MAARPLTEWSPATAAASTASTACPTTGRIDAHRLSPPRFCNAFNASLCERHFTPRGLCQWDPITGCTTSSACRTRVTAPTGRSYVFFKFHKVGSSTVGGTMRMAIIGSTGNTFASCLRHSKLREKTEVERERYKYCILCAKHDNSLVLLPYFRQPSVLGASSHKRLAALFASSSAAAKTLDEYCPMRASIGNELRTGTVIRRPVDRVISKYYFLRTYCHEKAQRTGKAGCAALELDLIPWLYAGQAGTDLGGLVRGSDWKVSYEVLGYLGDGNYTQRSLERAQATLDAIDVVGITERMDESMVLFSERWKLPLDHVTQSYVSLLVNPTKKPVNASTRALVAAHPAVARETELYEYALARFSREIARVPERERKVAQVKAAALACSLNASCVQGGVPQSKDDE